MKFRYQFTNFAHVVPRRWQWITKPGHISIGCRWLWFHAVHFRGVGGFWDLGLRVGRRYWSVDVSRR